ncbi:ABC superfamily ATP binding cassette transporter, solute-binding protein, partial [human gut metagenome]
PVGKEHHHGTNLHPQPSQPPCRRGHVRLALTLAACGANERSASGSGASGAATATAGGTLRILTSSTGINWDPAKSQSMPMTSLGLVHRRLTTWKLAEGKD